MKRSFDGTISWLRSVTTGREFPLLVFRADVDYATSRLASLSSTNGPEVVAVNLTDDEFNSDDATTCERRVNSELSRDDLRVVRFLRSVDTFNATAGISFQEYMNVSTPPKLFYSDIYDSDGEAELVREEPIDDFVKRGGTLLDRISGT